MIKKYIISMSCGKDSTYLCNHLLENFTSKLHEISGAVIFLSDWDFPKLEAHINKVERNIKDFLCANSIKNEFGDPHSIPFYYEGLPPGRSFEYYMCDHINGNEKGLGWPYDVRRRWCTGYKQMAIRRGITKVKRDVRSLYKSNGIDLKYRDIEICSMIGICIDEPARLRHVPDRTYPLADAGIKSSDCLELCKQKYGYDFEGLYDHFSRTGCFCCPRKSYKEISLLRMYYPELYQKALDMDKRQSKHFKHKKKLEDFENDKINTSRALQRKNK